MKHILHIIKTTSILTNNLKLYLYDGLMKIQRVMATELSPHRNKKKMLEKKIPQRFIQ